MVPVAEKGMLHVGSLKTKNLEDSGRLSEAIRWEASKMYQLKRPSRRALLFTRLGNSVHALSNEEG